VSSTGIYPSKLCVRYNEGVTPHVFSPISLCSNGEPLTMNSSGSANYTVPIFTSHPVDDFDRYDQELNLTGIPCRSIPWYGYYVGGIATTALCSFAIFGNIICIIVLSRPVMKSSVNFILLALSCSDLVQVVASLVMRGIWRICEYHCVWIYFTHWFQPIVTPYLFPIGTTG